MIEDKIFINKNKWKFFSKNELEVFENDVFNYYRKKGFPYYKTDSDWREKEFKKFMIFNKNTIFIKNDKAFRQVMHGLSFISSYFPHMFSIQCNNHNE